MRLALATALQHSSQRVEVPRGGGASSARWPTGTEDSSTGDAAGCSREPGLRLVVDHAARPCSSGVLPLPALGGDCSLDGVAVQFLVAQALLESEQKALAVKEEEEELKAVLASKEQRLLVEVISFARSQDRSSRLSPVEAVAATWCVAKNALLEGKEEEEKEEEEEEDEEDTLAPVWVPALLLFMTSLTVLFSLMGGCYRPLHLAVTCSIWFLPEEYRNSIFWEMLSGYVVFSASWFDSGYMSRPVYGGLFPYSAHCSQRSSISLSWCRGRFLWS